MKVKRIIFDESGKWSDMGYHADIYLYSDHDNIVGVFKGSTWPNPFNPRDHSLKLDKAYGAVNQGNYTARFSATAHNGKVGFDIENNGQLPTIAPNPNQDGKLYADHVDIHGGWNDRWRGSAACLTVYPSHYKDFCGYFEEGQTVDLSIIRTYNEVA